MCRVFLLILPLLYAHQATGFTCLDGSHCYYSTTCCPKPNGSYYCCLFPDGVCCEGGRLCCPAGSMCIGSRRCLRAHTLREAQPWSAKFPATRLHRKPGTDLHEPIREEVMMMLEHPSRIEQEQEERHTEDHLVSFKAASADIPCGSSTKCTGKSTCCPVKNGEGKIDHMCCPHRKAVCCVDFCCPLDYTCTVKGRRCKKKAHEILFYLND